MSASPISPELQSKIADWRRKATEGTLTLPEMREAILHLRAGRVSAANASATAKRKKAIAEIPHAEDLLSELKGL
jgi:hypothetical protein